MSLQSPFPRIAAQKAPMPLDPTATSITNFLRLGLMQMCVCESGSVEKGGSINYGSCYFSVSLVASLSKV